MIGWNIHTQIQALKDAHPDVYDCVDQERAELQQQRLARPEQAPADDFGTASAGGRGESYILAQRFSETRARGIRQLVDILVRNNRADSNVVVDLLGGDGLVSRVVGAFEDDVKPTIVTCDASPFMVDAARAYGIPALLQRAEASLFRTDSVGGVLLAYGSHHIPPADRLTVAEEAFRVLRPGGVFVLHDFPVGSPVDTWFAKVVDVYSETGHDYAHFAPDEATSYLERAGFEDVEITLIEDPFVVQGASRTEAMDHLGAYLVHMYGLVRLLEEHGEPGAYRRAFELAREIFRYETPEGDYRSTQVEYDETTGRWSATMPREALVGFGRKPGERPGQGG